MCFSALTRVESAVSRIAVSIRVPQELKELVDKYKIEPDDFRRMLEIITETLLFNIIKELLDLIVKEVFKEEIKRKVLEELRKEVTELSERLKHISDEEIAMIIREVRDSR